MPTETEVNGKLYMKDAAGNVTEVGSVNSIELAGEECQEAELKEIEGGYSGPNYFRSYVSFVFASGIGCDRTGRWPS